MTEAPHPLGWIASPDQINPQTIQCRRLGGKCKGYDTATHTKIYVEEKTPPVRALFNLGCGYWMFKEALVGRMQFWRRCAYWSVPIVLITFKICDGTASDHDLAELQRYVDHIRKPGGVQMDMADAA